MWYVKPLFYDAFRCIADKCPDTCCAGWQIVIDEESLERYAEGKDCFQKRLKNSIDWHEGCFYQYGGRCAMLNDDNLCDLVIERGEDWLCNTCDRYPRHTEEFEGLRELSLSLSCPVAAELILQEEPLVLVTETDDEEDPLADEFEDFDYLLFTQLEQARTVLFQIVQNRDIPLQQRMDYIVQMAYELQLCVDEERIFDMEDVVQSYEERVFHKGNLAGITESDAVLKRREERFRQMQKGFGFLYGLERLREDWTQVLDEIQGTLYDKDYAHYATLYEEFCNKYMKESWLGAYWEIYGEQLLMFFLYTYFCGAVYDECIYSKVAMAVLSVYCLQEMILCRWYNDGKVISRQECIRLAYRYAREVEHSDDNLNRLEEWLMDTM